MSFSDQQLHDLRAPLNRSHVKERSQAGRTLSYVESWHAIAEANRIFGFDNWDRETVLIHPLGDPRLVGDKFRVGYMAKVRITVRTADKIITREGCGFGSGIDKDMDQAHESALKEAESDAMKRGLMTFGNPFGLALYDKTQANVVSEPVRMARKSSAQAKRDGDHERILKLIRDCKDEETLDLWTRQRFDAETSEVPMSWLEPFKDEIEKHRDTLKQEAEFRLQSDPSLSGRVSGVEG